MRDMVPLDEPVSGTAVAAALQRHAPARAGEGAEAVAGGGAAAMRQRVAAALVPAALGVRRRTSGVAVRGGRQVQPAAGGEIEAARDRAGDHGRPGLAIAGCPRSPRAHPCRCWSRRGGAGRRRGRAGRGRGRRACRSRPAPAARRRTRPGRGAQRSAAAVKANRKPNAAGRSPWAAAATSCRTPQARPWDPASGRASRARRAGRCWVSVPDAAVSSLASAWRKAAMRGFPARLWDSPPPLWGRVREGGTAEPSAVGFPPPLTPPHKGEGKPPGGKALTLHNKPVGATRQCCRRNAWEIRGFAGSIDGAESSANYKNKIRTRQVASGLHLIVDIAGSINP